MEKLLSMKGKNLSQTKFLLTLILFTVCFSPAWISAQKVAPKKLTPREIAQQTLPSTVLLVMNNSITHEVKSGSGFFVAEDIVATNFHVIKETTEGYAKIYGQEKTYEVLGVVGIDKENDLALLKIKGIKGKPLRLNKDDSTAIGDEVFAVGNPKGLEGTFSQGIVSSIRKNGARSLLQITASISAGSSGGAILNEKGEVVGVAVGAIESGQSLNFAIPISILRLLINNQFELTSLTKINPESEAKSAIVDCDNLIFNLEKGDISGVNLTANSEEIKTRIPCFTAATPEGELWLNRGGGVFFGNHGLYFYTKIDLIEARSNFNGMMLPQNVLGLKGADVIKFYGSPNKIKTAKNQLGEPAVYFYYERKYGTLGFEFDNEVCSSIFVTKSNIDEM